MISYTSQRMGVDGEPMNWPDGSPAYKYTLFQFGRGYKTGLGEIILEQISCRLDFCSLDEMMELIKLHRGDLPLPELYGAGNIRETKWTRGLTWYEKGWK